jgi:hypothetical protein
VALKWGQFFSFELCLVLCHFYPFHSSEFCLVASLSSSGNTHAEKSWALPRLVSGGLRVSEGEESHMNNKRKMKKKKKEGEEFWFRSIRRGRFEKVKARELIFTEHMLMLDTVYLFSCLTHNNSGKWGLFSQFYRSGDQGQVCSLG